jgi:hypothetical protein
MNEEQIKPIGTQCGNLWYSDQITCPKLDNTKTFPNVAIIGAGIAGLSIAYELVKAYREQQGNMEAKLTDSNIQITVYEKSSYAGGKIIGYFRNDGKPVEHSTRIYTIGYVALFDILKNIPSIIQDKDAKKFKFDNRIEGRCVLDDLIPMFTNYKNANTFESNFTGMPGESPIEMLKTMIIMLKNNNVSNTEIIQIITKFNAFYSADYPTRLALTAGMTIGQYLDYPKLSVITQKILNSYIGVIVAARVQCDAFAIMGLFEALGVFGSPKTTKELKNSGLAGGNMFPGPSSVYFIDPLVNYLKNAGVKFQFNSTLEYADIKQLQNNNYDAVCLAVPHMVAADMLGPEIFPTSVLRNEWSFGVQYYISNLDHIDKIMNHRNEQNIYTIVLGSAWQVVYTIEYSIKGDVALKKKFPGYLSFWGIDDMGKIGDNPVLATITATVSNQYNPGITVGKPLLMCTPIEILTEILVQIGTNAQNIQNILSGTASFGSILYLNEADSSSKKYSSSEWMKGPLQSNGYRWLSDYTLFISTPTNPTFGTNGMCSITNIYNNPNCTDPNQLPLRITNTKDNAAFHYFGVSSKITEPNGQINYTVPTTFNPVPDRWYLAGEYCSTPNLQIPTMERACESGKIAAQKIISDFGIISKKRKDDFAKGIKPEVSLSNVSSVSLMVQVNGLQKTTDLINFVDLTTIQKIQGALYTGMKIGYPKAVKPILFLCIVILLGLVFYLTYRGIKK